MHLFLRSTLALLVAAGLAAPAAAHPDCAAAAPAASPAAQPQRGVWIATPEHTHFFDSREEMARQLDAFKAMGINTVFAAMWNQGRTLFPSRAVQATTGVLINEFAGNRDPLKELVDLAHARGLQVYAWFEFGFVSDFKGGPGHELMDRHPEWAALDRDGHAVAKNGFHWMNALDPQVQDFVLSVVMEAVRGYDIDGIQGDDRLPALPTEAGYNPATIEQYKQEHAGKAPPRDTRDPEWLAWRAARLTQFLERMNKAVKTAKPGLRISLSPSPFPWGYDEYLQDWPEWLRRGLADSFSPQLYRYDIEGYRKELRKISREQVCPAQLDRIAPGVLLALGKTYVASPEFLKAMVEENRREGIRGEVYFHSEGVFPRAALIRELYSEKPPKSK